MAFGSVGIGVQVENPFQQEIIPIQDLFIHPGSVVIELFHEVHAHVCFEVFSEKQK